MCFSSTLSDYAPVSSSFFDPVLYDLLLLRYETSSLFLLVSDDPLLILLYTLPLELVTVLVVLLLALPPDVLIPRASFYSASLWCCWSFSTTFSTNFYVFCSLISALSSSFSSFFLSWPSSFFFNFDSVCFSSLIKSGFISDLLFYYDLFLSLSYCFWLWLCPLDSIIAFIFLFIWSFIFAFILDSTGRL